MSRNLIASAVRRTLLLAAAASAPVFAPAAFAQDQEAASGAGTVEEVVVTGSRIPQPNVEGISPVAVVGAEEVAVRGITRVEDLVNNLPQAFADQGGNISNGSTGTATVNLRNLGSTRTLVLVNGRRLPPGTPGGTAASIAPDLNQIPSALIERVEVLTGGASSVYGSDAVAGVVNFIMKRDFEGIAVDTQYSFYSHRNDNGVGDLVAARGFATPDSNETDGGAIDANLTLGTGIADGKGNATVYLGYRKIDPVLQSERDYSACALGATATGFACSGSGTTGPGGQFQPYSPALRPGDAFTVAGPNGEIRPYSSTTDAFNFGPYNYFQRPDTRYVLGAFAHYDLAPQAQVYTELMFHDDRTVAQIAPSGLFAQLYTTNCDNPLLSAAQRSAMCGAFGLAPTADTNVLIGRRNVEGGGRQDDLRHTSYRGVVGVKGEIAQGWNYDVFGQYGTVVFAETYLNDFSIARGQRALQVVNVNGVPTCKSVVDGTDPNCVPYNIWRQGGVTPEALNYLQTPGFQRGDTQQSVMGATLAGDLGQYGVQLPTANEGLGVAIGAEYRQESLDLRTDQAFTTGDLAGQGGPTIGVQGSYNVKEYFAEFRAPLVQDRPWIQTLALNGSYRYSDYSTGVNTNSYGAGLEWAPLADVRLRGSYQRAVRAPNIRELFAAQGVQLFDLDEDPCSGTTPAATLAQCQRTGVTPGQYGFIVNNTAGQFNTLAGGNLDLDPEKADTFSYGIVFTPTFLDGLTASIDYFDIKLEDQVGVVPPTVSLQQCLQTGDPTFCQNVRRGQAGTLWFDPNGYIVGTNTNTGTTETSGIDTEVNYRFDLPGGMGGLAVNLIGTYLREFVSEPVSGLGTYDCQGLFGPTCGTPLPEWRHKARLSWTTPIDLDVSLTWRYISKVNLDLSTDQPLLTGTFRPVDREMPAQHYVDLAASYTFRKSYGVRVGINNVLDRDPPLSSQVGSGFGNGNTYPQVYDALGRYAFVALSANF
jgi:outer membrane receptor protein involved in Fe transport